MRLSRTCILLLVFTSLLCLSTAAISAKSTMNARTTKLYGKLPLSFVENQGQLNKQVRFVIRGPRASAFFRNDGVTFDLWNPVKKDPQNSTKRTNFKKSKKNEMQKHSALKLTFNGADPECQTAGIDMLPGKTNYMTGKDSTRWKTDISTYKGVIYKNIWQGIDIIYRGDRQQLKYDIRINPGADINQVKLQYDGARKIRLDKKGKLHINTDITKFIEKVPGIYQEKDGKKIIVQGGYRLIDKNTIGFDVKDADPSLPLIIDPASDLQYSTLLGGSGSDSGYSIAMDSSGCTYLTGETNSFDFPTTTGAYDTLGNGVYVDAFIAKLNPTGSELVYSTFLRGTAMDYGNSIAVDSSGCAYVTGVTYSYDFPTTAGAFNSIYNNGYDDGMFLYCDAFATKLNPSGNGLEYSTYISGDNYDLGYGIAIDTSGCAYITGQTTSFDFITTPGAFNSEMGCGAFVMKLNPSGSDAEYSTFLGGWRGDAGRSIAVDSSGCAYVTGETRSIDYSNFPTTTGAFDTTFNGGEYDAFVSKLNPSGSSLEYSTLLGGVESDFGTSIALDSSGCSYVAGYTWSSDFPTTLGAFDTTYNGGNYDAFVAKLNPSGSALRYSTFLGGSDWDCVFDIQVDSSGYACVTGKTTSNDFPATSGAFDTSYNGFNDANNGGDAFAARLNSSGARLEYSTFLGGTGSDEGHGIALDSSGYAYVIGYTWSADFPVTAGVFDDTLSNSDVFVSKILINPAPVNVSLTPAAGAITIAQKTILTSTYSDPAGYSSIKTCYLALNLGDDKISAGYLFYDIVKNKLYMKKPNETALIGGYVPGKAKIIDNGRIILYCNSTTIQRSGNNLIINWSIALKPNNTESTCTALMQVTNVRGYADPMELKGSFNLIPNPSPMNEDLTPGSGSITINQKTSFASIFSDPAGFSNIRTCYLLMSPGSTIDGAGYAFYDTAKNKLYLRKTDEPVLLGGYAPGSANVIDNGSIVLYCADTSIVKADTDMTINWSIALKSYFTGNPCTASMQVTNKTGYADPWEQMGVFTTE